jgi:hypothetical protein
LKEVESSSHFADSSVIASHVVVGHGLAQFVIFTKFFRFLKQVKSTVDIFFFEVVHGENIANFAELFACSAKLYRCRSKVDLFYFQQLLENSNRLYVFALMK